MASLLHKVMFLWLECTREAPAASPGVLARHPCGGVGGTDCCWTAKRVSKWYLKNRYPFNSLYCARLLSPILHHQPGKLTTCWPHKISCVYIMHVQPRAHNDTRCTEQVGMYPVFTEWCAHCAWHEHPLDGAEVGHFRPIEKDQKSTAP
jgi:hypothetical protein